MIKWIASLTTSSSSSSSTSIFLTCPADVPVAAVCFARAVRLLAFPLAMLDPIADADILPSGCKPFLPLIPVRRVAVIALSGGSMSSSSSNSLDCVVEPVATRRPRAAAVDVGAVDPLALPVDVLFARLEPATEGVKRTPSSSSLSSSNIGWRFVPPVEREVAPVLLAVALERDVPPGAGPDIVLSSLITLVPLVRLAGAFGIAVDA